APDRAPGLLRPSRGATSRASERGPRGNARADRGRARERGRAPRRRARILEVVVWAFVNDNRARVQPLHRLAFSHHAGYHTRACERVSERARRARLGRSGPRRGRRKCPYGRTRGGYAAPPGGQGERIRGG